MTEWRRLLYFLFKLIFVMKWNSLLFNTIYHSCHEVIQESLKRHWVCHLNSWYFTLQFCSFCSLDNESKWPATFRQTKKGMTFIREFQVTTRILVSRSLYWFKFKLSVRVLLMQGSFYGLNWPRCMRKLYQNLIEIIDYRLRAKRQKYSQHQNLELFYLIYRAK